MRKALPLWCEELGVRAVTDAGCGDGMWQPTLPGYHGVDVVPAVVSRCIERFPYRRYRLMDFVTDELPPCDAVLCRDALQHLSLADCYTALANFKRAGARFLFANSHRGNANADVPTGGWFPINLEAPPFAFPAPVREVPDGMWDGGEKWPGKVFGAWEL